MEKQISLVIDRLGLDRLLEDSHFDWDLRQGVIFSPAKTRMCLFSTDLLQGVFKAVLEEAGEAWSLIFKRCGALWGARLARRLDGEFSLLYGKKPEELPLADYCDLISAYFAGHGWARVQLDLENTQQTGVVEIRVWNSIFCEVIEHPEEMVDPMLSGIFASLLGHLARRELDCAQTECQSKGAPVSRFVVTAAPRIAAIAAEARAGATHEQLVGKL